MKYNLKQAYDYIINNVSIENIIGNYLDLKKKGNNFIALCPFHDDTNPSLSISPKKNIFKCFSCNAKGNGVTFVRDFKKISLYEAVKEIINFQNLPIELDDEKENEKYSFDFEKYYQCNLEFLKIAKYNFFEKEKYEDTIFFKRKISKKTLKTLNCGVCDKNTINVLKKKDFNNKDLVDLNLILENGQPTFNNFYVFPIFNLQNKIAGFFGIPKVVKELKYLNSKETILFNKNELLYNLNLALEQKKIVDYLILVEGYFDLFSLFSCDLKNVVATMGSTISFECLQHILKFSKIILSFDFDTAGINFTLKTILALLKNNFYNIFCVTYDLVCKDANEYLIKYNEEKLKKLYLNETINWYEYLFVIWNLKNKDQPINEEFFKFIAPFITPLNELNKEIVFTFFAKKTNFEKKVFTNYFFNNSLPQNTENKLKISKKTKKGITVTQYQSFILSNCINNQKNQDFIKRIRVNLNSSKHNFLLTLINNNFFGKIDSKDNLNNFVLKDNFYKNFFVNNKNILNLICEEYQKPEKIFQKEVITFEIQICNKNISNLKDFIINENNLLYRDLLRINYLIDLLNKKKTFLLNFFADLKY